MPADKPTFAPMPRRATWRAGMHATAIALALGCASLAPTCWAATEEVPYRSALDGPLLYQLLIGEIELNSGNPAQGLDVLFDAAKRTRDETLFKRAVQVAMQNRSGDQMQTVVKGWRQALPQSLEALRYQWQIALGFGRLSEAVEPFTALVEKSPSNEQNGVINALPQLLDRSSDRKSAASTFEPVLLQLAQRPALRTTALTTLGRLWLAADDPNKAVTLAEQAHATDKAARDPALLALEAMPRVPGAEKVTLSYLAQPGAEPQVRLAHGQTLAQLQRHVEAVKVLKALVVEKPDITGAWLTLGALHLELKQAQEAEQALERYLTLTTAIEASSTSTDDTGDAGDVAVLRAAALASGRNQAFLMMSQAAEQRGDFTAAAAWLERVDGNSRGLDVATRRATMLAKQGKIAEARTMIRNAPEVSPDDARSKVVAESQVLREVKRWQEAHDVLAAGTKRFTNDVDLIYEQAMMAEKLNRMDEMERLLRQVIVIKPDHHHAYNALGYSLADRGVRLEEAQALVRKALDFSPGDPFITDSLGWIEFRLGNRQEALRLLKQAWALRPDTEIGAHLGEVLWTAGDQEEARRVWRESRLRDANNDVLKETLARLKVDL